ncbi:MAG: putative cytoplasmic protein [Solirubrobacterales bacterium]|nr:putative cytoplasmic protein [Solirubrobacterales bacterium]
MCTRELAWIHPSVGREVERWRGLAASIPDPGIRTDALTALHDKRLNAEGAGLFAALPKRRDRHLLRLLVAFQILLDHLDTVSERPAPDPLANGRQLHLALRDALDPYRQTSDYYCHHPGRTDGGYVRALVQTCRDACRSLPAYETVRPLALQAAVSCSVQGLNHDPDPLRRDSRLEHWARRSCAASAGMSWWELTAAASSTLAIHALLALAADPSCARGDAEDVRGAYMPWICAASTMLDSYVDEAEDAANAGHNYLAHYPSALTAERRTRELVRRSLAEARRLRNGSRHALIAAGMVAMYLSADGARVSGKRRTTRALVRAGGLLTMLLLPVLRIWRRGERSRALVRTEHSEQPFSAGPHPTSSASRDDG